MSHDCRSFASQFLAPVPDLEPFLTRAFQKSIFLLSVGAIQASCIVQSSVSEFTQHSSLIVCVRTTVSFPGQLHLPPADSAGAGSGQRWPSLEQGRGSELEADSNIRALTGAHQRPFGDGMTGCSDHDHRVAGALMLLLLLLLLIGVVLLLIVLRLPV